MHNSFGLVRCLTNSKTWTGSPCCCIPIFSERSDQGFAINRLENYDEQCIAFAEKLGIICVNIDYRLAPENVFPTSVNDAWDAVRWVRNVLLSSLTRLDPKSVISNKAAGCG